MKRIQGMVTEVDGYERVEARSSRGIEAEERRCYRLRRSHVVLAHGNGLVHSRLARVTSSQSAPPLEAKRKL